MKAWLRKLWSRIRPAAEVTQQQQTEEVCIPGPQHPAPGLLELWQVIRRPNGDLVPRCIALVEGYDRAAVVRKAHDIAAEYGIGEYYLTTPAGQEVDCWVLDSVHTHREPEMTMEEAMTALRHSAA